MDTSRHCRVCGAALIKETVDGTEVVRCPNGHGQMVNQESLVAKGVGRVAGQPNELSIVFNREPTDSEMKIVHNVLRQLR